MIPARGTEGLRNIFDFFDRTRRTTSLVQLQAPN